MGDALQNYAPSIAEFEKMTDKIGLMHGKHLVNQIQVNPPYKNRSGALNRANKVEGGRGSLTFTNDVKSKDGFPYAIPLHDGSGLYGKFHRAITPKNGAYLVFKIKGNWIKTKSVKGVKPMQWFLKTWQKPENLKKLAQMLLKASSKIFDFK